MGITATTSDPCVHICGSDNLSILTTYVDDLLFGGATPLPKHNTRQLMDRFAMTGTGGVSMVLGMQITREAETLTISHGHYARSVLARLGRPTSGGAIWMSHTH